MLSPPQLERLTNGWQLEYDLEEGDMIIRTGRTQLKQNMIIARSTFHNETVPAQKRQRISYEQIQTGI
jgi:hypothetical protein